MMGKDIFDWEGLFPKLSLPIENKCHSPLRSYTFETGADV